MTCGGQTSDFSVRRQRQPMMANPPSCSLVLTLLLCPYIINNEFFQSTSTSAHSSERPPYSFAQISSFHSHPEIYVTTTTVIDLILFVLSGLCFCLDGHKPVYIQPTHVKMAAPSVLVGALCFVASSVSSAGGVGGGGMFIPILTIVAGLDLRTASSLSAFMVTGGSMANLFCNLFATPSDSPGVPLVDYDIALLSEPCMLLGVSVGVICNSVFPEWLTTVIFAIFLAWSTFNTCQNGILHWNGESEELRKKGLVENESSCEVRMEEIESLEAPLLRGERKSEPRFPWKKLGVLILVWFSFYLVSLARGNRYGQSIVEIEPCGFGYWTLSALQIPLAIAFTTWILNQKESSHHHRKGVEEDLTGGISSKKLAFPLMALLAGILGGVFGIGGGMLISPLLLQFGIAPEVTSATTSFMVFFSSTMSACQYLLLGMDHLEIAIYLSLICFLAALLGLVVVRKAIDAYGRASLIVFSVGAVMALSCVLMTAFGALDVWRNYISGKYMGFKLPC